MLAEQPCWPGWPYLVLIEQPCWPGWPCLVVAQVVAVVHVVAVHDLVTSMAASKMALVQSEWEGRRLHASMKAGQADCQADQAGQAHRAGETRASDEADQAGHADQIWKTSQQVSPQPALRNATKSESKKGCLNLERNSYGDDLIHNRLDKNLTTLAHWPHSFGQKLDNAGHHRSDKILTMLTQCWLQSFGQKSDHAGLLATIIWTII